MPERLIKQEKNENEILNNVSNASRKKVWWICPKGHEWKNTISHRSNGQSCPYCSNSKVVSGTNDLASLRPELLEEWNYDKNKDYNPNELSEHSGKKIWWICSKGHEWEARICDRNRRNSKCPHCKNNK